jgi:hypothetical protein
MRIIRFALLSLFLWLIAGQVIVFQFEHSQIKHKVKQMLKGTIPESQLVTFNFGQHELNKLDWIKSNEFKFQNQYFDVVKKEILSDGSVRFKCISDKQETKLFQKLNQTVAIKLANSEDSPFSVWLKLLKFPFLQNDEVELVNLNLIESNDDFFNYQFICKSFRFSSEVPPPNFTFFKQI